MITHRTISLVQYRKAGELSLYIRSCIAEGECGSLSIGELCKKFASCETVLTRGFKQRYGVTIHRFIMAEKMALAKELLSSHGLDIRDIAFMIGYTELSNFSRDFARFTGQSPMAWRGKGAGRPADVVTIQ
ncbi:MAG: AraC family transcriptional regulator [Sediminibacterium sp.]